MQDNARFLSSLITLSRLDGRQFVIPTYQRPYVWGIEQIEKLLSDAFQAFLNAPKSPYFIGTVLTKQRAEAYELIDGQQRFTTLWMIAAVFQQLGIPSLLTAFLKQDKRLRIDFEIRRDITAYFEQLSLGAGEGKIKYSDEEIREKPYLEGITMGLTIIELRISELSARKSDMTGFGNFIYEQLVMVENLAPEKVDLNKLFATINSTGIQLEQSDILKSKLLRKISNKLLYSKIWEACENMEDYFERNVRRIFTKTVWSVLSASDFSTFSESVFLLKGDESIPEKGEEETIASMFAYTGEDSTQTGKKEGPEVQKGGYCRSIITFPQLLIHTYRIHRYKNGDKDFAMTFHGDRLIRIFEELGAKGDEEIEAFFRLLWETRFILDKYIIKWTADLDSKDMYLELTGITKNSDHYFGRSPLEKSASQMLQSVLYFTGDYLRQYWLTPALFHLGQPGLLQASPGSAEVLQLLESIDNTLSMSEQTDKETSFALLADISHRPFSYGNYLRLPEGTGFYRYWFQKLEYILWKNWTKRETPEFKAFRITSKNSIEHIFPQQPEDRKAMDADHLHSFGNLVLLTVSQNSEYGRKQVPVKRAEFEGKDHYDSLKSKKIFNMMAGGTVWGEDAIARHRDEMIDLITDHYNGIVPAMLETHMLEVTIDNDEHNDE